MGKRLTRFDLSIRWARQQNNACPIRVLKCVNYITCPTDGVHVHLRACFRTDIMANTTATYPYKVSFKNATFVPFVQMKQDHEKMVCFCRRTSNS